MTYYEHERKELPDNYSEALDVQSFQAEHSVSCALSSVLPQQESDLAATSVFVNKVNKELRH